MLKQIQRWSWALTVPSFWYPMVMVPIFSSSNRGQYSYNADITIATAAKSLNIITKRVSRTHCDARRRVRYDYDEEEDDEEGEYGHNEEIAMLELYSQSARGEALIVHAVVDGQEVEVLIFKGFSSCLSYGTSPDLSKSILPARAVIQSIDRIKGPFDPSNIDYLEKGLTWETFKKRLIST